MSEPSSAPFPGPPPQPTASTATPLPLPTTPPLPAPPLPTPVLPVSEAPRWFGIRLSPLAQRRLARFKRNRRGYVSLWILAGMFAASVCASLIANNEPLLVRYKGSFYFPALVSYPETTFGGQFETRADFLDLELRQSLEAAGAFMLWAPVHYDYATIDFSLDQPAPAPPSRRHWLGTDDTNRDVFARLLYGFRVSMLFGMLLTFCSAAIGITAGAIQGYFGGLVDLFMQRMIEIFAGLPVVYLLIIFASMIEPGFFGLLTILLVFSWLSLVGVVRAEFLRARNFDYVRAARALGAGPFTIIRRHVLPNATVAALTFVPFLLAGSISTLTALDFLGLGLPLTSPSLGEVLQQGKANLYAPWIGLSAAFALGSLLTLIIFVSEAVRDAFDPRKLLV